MRERVLCARMCVVCARVACCVCSIEEEHFSYGGCDGRVRVCRCCDTGPTRGGSISKKFGGDDARVASSRICCAWFTWAAIGAMAANFLIWRIVGNCDFRVGTARVVKGEEKRGEPE